MTAKKVQHLRPGNPKEAADSSIRDRSILDLYQSFMVGYVKKINEASFNVTIGGVRIGAAKYSRLAQINLQSRIITFSRFAVENVPERGRRYLVLHELAHVKEASHNKRFWQFVEMYEPDYKAISRELEVAFKRNIREEQLRLNRLRITSPFADPERVPASGLFNYKLDGKVPEKIFEAPEEGASVLPQPEEDSVECMEDAFSGWLEPENNDGIIYGGSNEIIQLKLAFD